MNARSQTEPLDIAQEVRALRRQFRSLLLATTSESGVPNASYAPYVLIEGSFFILVSQLAKHTVNLLSNRVCSVLFIESEESTTNIFARRRLSCDCAVELVDRESPLAAQVLHQFAQAFGPVVGMLTNLPDFVLFELKPKQCNYVRGFGQAMKVDADALRDD